MTPRPDSYTFARALPGWLKGLRALIGGVSEMRAVAYEQRGDLTSRFIKVFPEFGSSKNQPVTESVAKLWACVTFGITRRFRVELTRFPWETA